MDRAAVEDRILDTAKRAARAASAICRRVLAEASATPDSMSKLGDEPVTIADYGSQAVILREVSAAFPDHAVLAEEGAAHLREHAGEAARASIVRIVGEALGQAVSFDRICSWIDHAGSTGGKEDYTWVIDPIDGTQGFLRREQYAVAIGVLRRGEPWAGVLACPSLPVDPVARGGPLGVLYCAVRGKGTRREAIDGGKSVQARVSAVTRPAETRILGSVESAHGDPRVVTAVIADLGLGGGIVRIDSQAKYGLVADGTAEIYLRPQSKPDWRERVWDHAAGVLVVEEAGGRVTDLAGRKLDFSRGARLEENRGVLATNGPLHDRLLESLARVGGVVS
jgi:3'(2'), 5'-bisphosphate nucleotidase